MILVKLNRISKNWKPVYYRPIVFHNFEYYVCLPIVSKLPLKIQNFDVSKLQIFCRMHERFYKPNGLRHPLFFKPKTLNHETNV